MRTGAGLMVLMIELIPVIVISITLLGGIAIVLAGIYQQIRTREMAHRERLAMIEKGIAPPPERDPEAFEQSLRPRRTGHSRAMAAGIVTIAFGVALAFLISLVAAQPGIGLGVGGAIAIVGVAFVINGYLAEAHRPDENP